MTFLKFILSRNRIYIINLSVIQKFVKCTVFLKIISINFANFFIVICDKISNDENKQNFSPVLDSNFYTGSLIRGATYEHICFKKGK